MLDSLTKKQKIIFFIVLSIMIIVIIYYIYFTLYKNNFNFSYSNNNLVDTNLLKNNQNIIYGSDTTMSNFIIVYICGAVKENKVVTLKENSRICDAINEAGGLTDDADLTYINLAYILEDGEKIYIPKKGEEIQTEDNTSNYENFSYNYSSSNNKININKASQSELEAIPGIGPSTALKIINYRKDNGNFSNIEDIKDVSGIGDTKYEKIKNYICVK